MKELVRESISDKGCYWDKGKVTGKLKGLHCLYSLCQGDRYVSGIHFVSLKYQRPETPGMALLTPIFPHLSRSCLFLTVDWFAVASSMRCQIQTAPRDWGCISGRFSSSMTSLWYGHWAEGNGRELVSTAVGSGANCAMWSVVGTLQHAICTVSRKAQPFSGPHFLSFCCDDSHTRTDNVRIAGK